MRQDSWWSVYPLGACGAPIREGWSTDARLHRLESWLDYAADLGVSGLNLGPVFASQSHGYDTVDHYRIDPRLGGDDDFDQLVAASHAHGLRVMLDGVFNHVGDGHPLVIAARTGDQSAAGMLADGGWRSFEGHGSLVTLNHSEPRVAEFVGDIMLHWLRRGVDGWRLDAAYAIPPVFWRGVVPRVRAEFPDAYLVGEMIHGDYARYVAESGLDSMTQYELWKGIWSAITDRNAWELAWALTRHSEMVAHFVPFTFVGNHDVTRIASQVGDGGAALALAVLGTVAGTPSIYYGDEQAFRGVKTSGFGGDDEVRPALPERPSDLAPFGGWLFRLHRDVLQLRRDNPWLAACRTDIVSKSNDALVYRSHADGGELTVSLDLVAQRAVIRHAGGELVVTH